MTQEFQNFVANSPFSRKKAVEHQRAIGLWLFSAGAEFAPDGK
jgi:hypothetical protein